MNTPTQGPKALADQITALDLTINKLNTWLNAPQYLQGSIFLSGRTSLHADFHEIIAWNKDHLKVPADLLRRFLEKYAQQLIVQRMEAVKQIEALANPIIEQHIGVSNVINSTQQLDIMYCPICERATVQRFIEDKIRTWQCMGCLRSNEIAEID